MGYCVYAHCYVRQDAPGKTDFLAAIRRLEKASLFVPHAEPISVLAESLNELLEPIPRFERVAWVLESPVWLLLWVRGLI